MMKALWALVVSGLLGYVAYYLFADAPSYTYNHSTDKDDGSFLSGLGDPALIPLVSVGEFLIRREDVDFEHQLYDAVRHKKLESHVELADQDDNENDQDDDSEQDYEASLRVFFLQSLIKRKLLYEMLSDDSQFDPRGEAIMSACEQEFEGYVATLQEINALTASLQKEKLRLRLCESRAIAAYIDEHINGDVHVSEAEIKAYYQEHRMEFFAAKRILIRHIHFVDERSARKVAAKVNSQNFARYAQKYSIAAEASQGGLLGPFAAHEMPPFFTQVFRLKLRRVSSIVKSPYGYHIFLPLKKYPEKIFSLSEVRNTIVQRLEQQYKKERYQEWFQLALNTVPVRFASHPEQLPHLLLTHNNKHNYKNNNKISYSMMSSDTPSKSVSSESTDQTDQGYNPAFSTTDHLELLDMPAKNPKQESP
ncbi:MAG: peptidyl-prolyl cis-trans isomerase [Proteobacteria bacterium]|nr:peptidyl-prolyl cis-trans isomerase [Pseudomonadota bacterium]